MISRTDGEAFTVTEFSFSTQGQPSVLGVGTSNSDVTASGELDYLLFSLDGNDSQFVDMSADSLFAGIFFIAFTNDATGNLRVDDIGIAGDPNVVPLPAAGWMLLAGVAGLYSARRRSKKV